MCRRRDKYSTIDLSKQKQALLCKQRVRLRYFSPEGELIPTPKEAARAADQKATYAEQKADMMATKLQELGIDPDALT